MTKTDKAISGLKLGLSKAKKEVQALREELARVKAEAEFEAQCAKVREYALKVELSKNRIEVIRSKYRQDNMHK